VQDVVFFHKILPLIIYFVAVLGAIGSGVLVYYGLASKTERNQTRLKVKQQLKDSKMKMSKQAGKSTAEHFLKQAGYPLGMNGAKYYIFYASLMIVLMAYYIVGPFIAGSYISTWRMLFIVAVYLIFLPSFRYSLFRYMLNALVSYKQAKRNSEVFMLYDLIINELESMEVSRINTYNLIRNLKPYFEHINHSLTQLLSRWTDDGGPSEALDKFGEEIGTKEAKALASTLKTLDDNDRTTVLRGLKGMNDMFVRSQIENYRRRRKVITDVGSLPIRITHFLILLNFIAVVVYMVTLIMQHART